ncbi:MAG: glycosyltransferase family 2 protein [Microgenomates group bacterium]
MAASSKIPSVSFVIPVLNSGDVLANCLFSIRAQKYPQNKIKIIIVDGGSTDETIDIARSYHCHIIENSLKTAEAGKSIGVDCVSTDLVALIDSDNILPSTTWLKMMVIPLRQDSRILGAEPWSFTYRSLAGFIERYSSLIGANDPYTLIAGNYDRQNLITNNWTSLNIHIYNHRYYQSFAIKRGQIIPTIGANGTIYRSNFLQQYKTGDYFFDIDYLSLALKSIKQVHFAKVKIGIIHTYCESSLTKFYQKQLRRVKDLYIYKNERYYPLVHNHFKPSFLFTLYVLTIFPMIYHSLLGYFRQRDKAWFFHPIACIITFYVYSTQTILYFLGLNQPQSRHQWHQ